MPKLCKKQQKVRISVQRPAIDYIYKIVPKSLWDIAQKYGQFDGAAVDITSGFIHFSTAEQLAETANKHFRGQTNLLLITVATAKLGDTLRYEPSRRGQLFPHLYGALPLAAVVKVETLDTSPKGHFF